MKNSHNIYLVSDSTGETLDRIFLALKAQFESFDYRINQFSFIRTETQIKKIIEDAYRSKNSIILYISLLCLIHNPFLISAVLPILNIS